MLNKTDIIHRNFEQEKRKKQSIGIGMGFYLPGLIGIFTLFPVTSAGLIILGSYVFQNEIIDIEFSFFLCY